MKFDESKVSYEIEAFMDCTEIRGNVIASGDDKYDKMIEDKIIDELDCGNVWAWCIVRVIATYEGVDDVCGDDYLGCCSYKDEEDFKSCPYYEDMKSEALDDLRGKLERIYEILEG